MTNVNDPRRVAIKNGLNQLNTNQLQRILDTPAEQMVFDTYNYDESTGKYCPLATGLGFPDTYKSIVPMTDAELKRIILDWGYFLNEMSRIPGRFYTSNRAEDAVEIVRELIRERG